SGLFGPEIKEFEDRIAKYCGVSHGVSTTNGYAALHLAFAAIGIGPDDEVLVSTFTNMSTVFPIVYQGAKPIPIDSEPRSWNLDPSLLEEKITPQTKAIAVVHIYGHTCDMDSIKDIAKKYNLKIVEDAAEVHGAEYKGKKCGSLGDIAAFSFFANKIATTGEGGMVITNDDQLEENSRYYKNLCFPIKGSRNYVHNNIGFNYRMSNLHAAVGLAQVEKLDYYVEKRRKINSLYKEQLKDVPGITFQPELNYARNVYWMNGAVINEKEFGMGRDELMLKLKENGIDSRLFFTGMHKQPSLIKYGCDVSDNYPVSEFLEKNGFYFPSGSNLTVTDIEYICDVIKKINKTVK
ncbi:MAG: DegT/DnrJ/EryC1/StrS family aminotransferase, partial [Bacteroidetes bacterium]|nr:DegT/DnrJ/EryC1/StrS family aminotransferase [Bacteroidota bacterium]